MLFCTLLQKDLRADEKLIHRTCFHISAQGCRNGIVFENFSPVALSHEHMLVSIMHQILYTQEHDILSKTVTFFVILVHYSKSGQLYFDQQNMYCTGLNQFDKQLTFPLSLQIPPTEACNKALMKMMYCPHCRGLTQTKPCNNYCLNTMKGCLAYHSELNSVWNDYIGKNSCCQRRNCTEKTRLVSDK